MQSLVQFRSNNGLKTFHAFTVTSLIPHGNVLTNLFSHSLALSFHLILKLAHMGPGGEVGYTLYSTALIV